MSTKASPKLQIYFNKKHLRLNFCFIPQSVLHPNHHLFDFSLNSTEYIFVENFLCIIVGRSDRLKKGSKDTASTFTQLIRQIR